MGNFNEKHFKNGDIVMWWDFGMIENQEWACKSKCLLKMTKSQAITNYIIHF
jgi:hypothetical protein